MSITDNRYATNDTDLREINQNIDSTNSKMGEVQLTPTEYTILGRLKNIENNTANQSSSSLIPFSITTEFSRSANTSAYALNQIVNAIGANTLLTIDFSSLGSYANKNIQISSASLFSNYGNAPTKILANIYLYNSSTLGITTLTDGSIFNPTYADHKTRLINVLDKINVSASFGGNSYIIYQTEMARLAKLDALSKIYAAIVTTTAYTPANGETFNLTLKGYIL